MNVCAGLQMAIPISWKRSFSRRLNSRCTGQRPASVQGICPVSVTEAPSTLSTPQSCRSLSILAGNSGSLRISAAISVNSRPTRSVSS